MYNSRIASLIMACCVRRPLARSMRSTRLLRLLHRQAAKICEVPHGLCVKVVGPSRATLLKRLLTLVRGPRAPTNLSIQPGWQALPARQPAAAVGQASADRDPLKLHHVASKKVAKYLQPTLVSRRLYEKTSEEVLQTDSMQMGMCLLQAFSMPRSTIFSRST